MVTPVTQKRSGTTPASLLHSSDRVVQETYGLGIGIYCDDHRLIDQLLACMPPNSILAHSADVDCLFSVRTKFADAVTERFKLYSDHGFLFATSDWTEMLAQFESNVGIFVAENASDYVFVHAGCVSLNGKAILIPGRSYSGKSSLVAALLCAGATY